MTSAALTALTEAIQQGSYSEGWKHECTNHPYRLIGTSGFEIVADGNGDFEARVCFGCTNKRSVVCMDIPIETIDTGYEGQSVEDGYVRLQSFRHPTWSWAWGGITVLLDDTKLFDTQCAEEDEENEECECIPLTEEPKVDTISSQRPLEAWLA